MGKFQKRKKLVCKNADGVAQHLKKCIFSSEEGTPRKSLPNQPSSPSSSLSVEYGAQIYNHYSFVGGQWCILGKKKEKTPPPIVQLAQAI